MFKKMTILSLVFVLFTLQILNCEEKKIIKFGLITDTHVCDKANQSDVISVNASPRYFAGGLSKLEAFSNAMNKANSSFVVELGDFTDNPKDYTLSSDKKKSSTLEYALTAEAKLGLFKGPRYHVLGNHDTDQSSKEDVFTKLTNTGINNKDGKYYYSWNVNGIHFIVLDAGYKANGASYSGVPGTPGFGYSWDDANVPLDEINWLKNDLAINKMPTIIFTHQLLNPQDQIESGFDMKHLISNASDIRTILEKSGQVLAVFSGHYHDGGFQKVNSISYIVLQANAAYGEDASYHNQYATIEVYKDDKNYKIIVAGNGNQKNYIINVTL